MATLYSIDVSTVDYNQPLAAGRHRSSLVRLMNQLRRLMSGANSGRTTISVRNSAVKASGTITCDTAVATDTVTINGVTFTGDDTPTGDQFDTSDTDEVAAASLAAAINASTTAGIPGIVTASASGAVVTVTAAVPGKIGNAITLASSGATLAVSAARLASGAETAFTYSL
jgi:phage tail sheath gpL-like